MIKNYLQQTILTGRVRDQFLDSFPNTLMVQKNVNYKLSIQNKSCVLLFVVSNNIKNVTLPILKQSNDIIIDWNDSQITKLIKPFKTQVKTYQFGNYIQVSNGIQIYNGFMYIYYPITDLCSKNYYFTTLTTNKNIYKSSQIIQYNKNITCFYLTHSYSKTGQYNIKISGDFKGFNNKDTNCFNIQEYDTTTLQTTKFIYKTNTYQYKDNIQFQEPQYDKKYYIFQNNDAFVLSSSIYCGYYQKTSIEQQQEDVLYFLLSGSTEVNPPRIKMFYNANNKKQFNLQEYDEGEYINIKENINTMYISFYTSDIINFSDKCLCHIYVNAQDTVENSTTIIKRNNYDIYTYSQLYTDIENSKFTQNGESVQFYFNNKMVTYNYLKKIISWGSQVNWENLSYSFYNANKLISIPQCQMPNINDATSAFYNCTNLTYLPTLTNLLPHCLIIGTGMFSHSGISNSINKILLPQYLAQISDMFLNTQIQDYPDNTSSHGFYRWENCFKNTNIKNKSLQNEYPGIFG